MRRPFQLGRGLVEANSVNHEAPALTNLDAGTDVPARLGGMAHGAPIQGCFDSGHSTSRQCDKLSVRCNMPKEAFQARHKRLRPLCGKHGHWPRLEGR